MNHNQWVVSISYTSYHISFMPLLASFVTYEKVLIKCVAHRISFLSFKILRNFSEQVRKMWPKSSEMPVK